MTSERDDAYPFQIPKSHAEALGELADLDDTDFSALLRMLSEEAHTIDRWAVSESLDAADLLQESTARALMASLTELSSVRHATSADAAEIAERVLVSPPFDDMEAEDQDRLSRRVVEILDCSNIRLAGKALELGSIRERVFAFAEIHTDLRPVFGEQGDDLLAESGVLAHVLRLHHISSEGSHKDFYVALDDDDLEILRDVIDRAERKSESLRHQLHRAGLRLVGKEFE